MAFQNLPPPPPTKNADSALDRWLQLMRDKISAAGSIVWSQISLPTKAANTVLAGPTTGADAQVDFRALVNDDLPTVAITKGGTGQTTQTAAFDALAPTTTQGDIIYYNGTDNVRLAKGTAAQRLTMNAGATAPEWQTDTGTGTVTSVDGSGGTTGLTLTGGPITTSGTLTIGGTLDADNGGTGQSSYAVGDLLYASTTTALSKLADVAVGSYLRSGGVTIAPLWSTLKLPNAATVNRIPYATSSDTWGDSAGLTFNGTDLTISGVTYATKFSAGNGSVSAPSFYATGDTNTGVYFPSADTLGLVAGGVARLRIDSQFIQSIDNYTGVKYLRLYNGDTGGASGATIYAETNAGYAVYEMNSTAAGGVCNLRVSGNAFNLYTEGNKPLQFGTNNTIRAAMDGTGAITKFANITTSGSLGLTAIVATGRATAQTAAVASVSTFTVGASDGSFEISANINVTTSTAHNFTVTCAYTDEGNTVRTLTLGFTQLSGATFITAITNVTGAGPYESPVYHIRCKAATAITFATTGTFTTVTYNVEGIIKQTA